MKKFHILFNAIKGEWLKIFAHNYSGCYSIGHNNENRHNKVIVSLTSYGRRAKKIVDTTIKSLLKQSYKPDRIILWLDNENWNQNNLPINFRKLEEYGVEIRFCEDIKSYKKLIPTLEVAGDNDYIVTVDDDQYYPKDFLKGLVEAMDDDPNSVHAYQVHKVGFQDGTLLPYNQWDLCTDDLSEGLFFPTGVGGIIYRKALLNSDVTKKSLYMSLAPKADDIWFFFMALLNGVKCHPVVSSSPLIPIDLFYQKFHSQSSLRDSNWGNSLNDKQMRAVMEHYGLTDKYLLEQS